MKKIKGINLKYPFNINNIRKEKALNENNDNKKGFYDSIEKKDIKIRLSKIQLKKIKSNSIKELIYSNKSIPEHWKNKTNYNQDILNIFSKDQNIVSYLGRGKNSISDFESSENKFGIYPSNNQYIYNYLFRNNNSKNLENIKKFSLSSININKLSSKKSRSTYSSKNEFEENHNSNFIRQKFFQRMKKEYSDKEIINILEDLRTAFPLKENFDLIIKNEESKRNKHLLSNSFSDNLTLKTLNLSKENKKNSYMINPIKYIYKIPERKKIKALKESVYNNIMLVKIKNNIEQLNSINKKKKEELSKTIDIINPIIKKKLEHINNFGPFSNFCQHCRKRNIDFYNKLEHNRCLKLIHYIKKSKGNQFLSKTNSEIIKKKIINNSSII